MQTPNELFLNSHKSSIFPVCFHGTSRLSGDLLDGFIPRLLREEHPDGVALKGVDRTKVSFRQWLKDIDGWIAESVPCSSSRSIVDHRRRQIRSWSMGASAWEQRWDTQSMRPRYAGPGAEETEELDLEPESFFSLLLTVRVLHSALSAIEKWYSSLVCFV